MASSDTFPISCLEHHRKNISNPKKPTESNSTALNSEKINSIKDTSSTDSNNGFSVNANTTLDHDSDEHKDKPRNKSSPSSTSNSTAQSSNLRGTKDKSETKNSSNIEGGDKGTDSVSLSPSRDSYLSKMKSQAGKELEKIERKKHELNNTLNHYGELAGLANPFRLLGFYKEIPDSYFNGYQLAKPTYGKNEYNIKKNPSYCDYSDLYSIFNPSSIFTKMTAITDYYNERNSFRSWH